jgi:glycosyltransferase involved in cell wall biosynthesis
LLKTADQVIAVSNDGARKLKRMGVASDRTHVIRNSIVAQNYPFKYRSSKVRDSLRIPDHAYVIGTIGRLSKEKGQEGLIRQFAELRQIVPDAHLIVAGDGPDCEKLKRAVADLELSKVAHLIGYCSDVADFYGGIDVLVLNSSTEGLPNVVLEAMAFGVPVVATAVGGTPELIQSAEYGTLVAPGDSDALLRGILSVRQDPSAAGQRTRNARKFIESEFDMRTLISRTHELYRKCVSNY